MDYDCTPEPVELPIDGTLDLHAFRPADIGTLIPDYLEECRNHGITEVRLVHGKGTGALRRSVHAILDRLDVVQHYRLADETGGSWGATLVALRRKELPASSQ
jgi:DNA-nicking Smr family endonuclease